MSKEMFQYTLLQEQTGAPSCCYSVQSKYIYYCISYTNSFILPHCDGN